jgi:site-specific DNA recombinase
MPTPQMRDTGLSAPDTAASTTSTRTALYVRVSTQAQAERWSLPAQRQILRDLAERRGWDATLYDEGGASAETIAARPVMQQLLADVSAGRVDMVAVVEMERLCRASDLRDWATITTTLREAGVLVCTPERVFNLATAEDDFEADLRGILSKREKRKLLERTKRGLDQAKDAGKFAGGQPMLGYLYDRNLRQIVPDPETVPLVQRIFESDLSHWQLYRQLKAEGIDVWYQRIERIRSHPFYLGLRKDSKGKLIKADWPAIVSQELWDKQNRRPKRAVRRSSRRPGPAYLLSGIVRCKNCGGPAVGTPVRRSKSGDILQYCYKCHGWDRCAKGGGRLPGWLVDMLVVDALTQYAGDPDALKRRFGQALDAVQGGLVAERRAQLEAKIRDLEERQTRLLDALERGIVSDRVAKRRSVENEEALRQTREQIEVLVASAYVPSLPDLQAILDLAGKLESASQTERRDLLQRLALTVTMDPRERLLEITWRLGGQARYRVPAFRGGPGRSLERFQEIAASRLAECRILK